MIPRSATIAFENRSLRDYGWIKKSTDNDIDWALDQLEPQFHTHTTPYLHQKICAYLAVTCPQFGFFLEMGLGKSKIILDSFIHRKERGDVTSLLVVVPWLLHLYSWQEQVKLHAPQLSCVVLAGTRNSRWKAIKEKADIFVINYAGLVSMVSAPGKKKRHPKKELSRELGKYAQMIVLDESTAVKNRKSAAFKVCSLLAQSIEYRYILTGTPFGRSPEDLWSQVFFLDGGKTLGQHIGLFFAAFFNEHNGYFKTEWKFDERKSKHLTRRLRNCTIQFRVNDCLDLPNLISSVHKVDPSPEIGAYLRRIKDKMNEDAKTGDHDSSNGLARHFIHLRQLASGFASFADEDGKKQTITFSSNPKLEALIQLLDGIDRESKVVVFHFFIYSGQLIEQALGKIGLGCVRIWSGSIDKPAALATFQNDPECRVLVINEQIGAMGLNLQMANYVVFFESPVSPIIRAQAEARCRRVGQNKSVFCFDLITKGSVDERIHLFVSEGRDLLQAIIRGKEPLF